MPNSIGNLNSLQVLDLEHNNLTTLPEDFENLTNLKDLNLSWNKLNILPNGFWKLKNLKFLQLSHNSWNYDFQNIESRDIPSVLEICKKRASISIFISHAVIDFDYFQIVDLVDFLEQQDEIYQVIFCEEDLAGNIDEFMEENIPKSQLILFFASNNSVFNSEDCTYELELAKRNKIQIIPIKGKGIKWEDLQKVGLSRELGLKFNKEYFNPFCEKLYQYILEFKRNIDLFNPKKAFLDRQKLYFKNMMEEFIDSDIFEKILLEKEEIFQKVIEELENKQITLHDFFIKTAEILKK